MEKKELTGNVDKSYKFPETEKEYVHVRLIQKQFDPKTGKPLTKPFVQKYDRRAYAGFLKHPNGFTIEAELHLPEGVKSAFQVEAEETKELKKGK